MYAATTRTEVYDNYALMWQTYLRFLQVVLKHNESPDPRLDPSNPLHESQQWLEPGAMAIFVGKAHFGCLATVLPPLNQTVPICSEGHSGLGRAKRTAWIVFSVSFSAWCNSCKICSNRGLILLLVVWM